MPIQSGDNVVKTGQTVQINWESNDLSSVNFYLYKQNRRISLLFNKQSGNGANQTTWIPTEDLIDTENPYVIRLEMENNSTVYDETEQFYIIKYEAPIEPIIPIVVANLDVSSIVRGASAVLGWNTQKASKVIIDGIGEVTTNGTKVVSPATTTNYKITAVSSDGNSSVKTVTLTVTDPVILNPVINSFTSNKTKITGPQNVQLSWSTANAYSVELKNSDSDALLYSGNNTAGTIDVYQNNVTRYTLIAYGDNNKNVMSTVSVDYEPIVTVPLTPEISNFEILYDKTSTYNPANNLTNDVTVTWRMDNLVSSNNSYGQISYIGYYGSSKSAKLGMTGSLTLHEVVNKTGLTLTLYNSGSKIDEKTVTLNTSAQQSYKYYITLSTDAITKYSNYVDVTASWSSGGGPLSSDIVVKFKYVDFMGDNSTNTYAASGTQSIRMKNGTSIVVSLEKTDGTVLATDSVLVNEISGSSPNIILTLSNVSGVAANGTVGVLAAWTCDGIIPSGHRIEITHVGVNGNDITMTMPNNSSVQLAVKNNTSIVAKLLNQSSTVVSSDSEKVYVVVNPSILTFDSNASSLTTNSNGCVDGVVVSWTTKDMNPSTSEYGRLDYLVGAAQTAAILNLGSSGSRTLNDVVNNTSITLKIYKNNKIVDSSTVQVNANAYVQSGSVGGGVSVPPPVTRSVGASVTIVPTSKFAVSTRAPINVSWQVTNSVSSDVIKLQFKDASISEYIVVGANGSQSLYVDNGSNVTITVYDSSGAQQASDSANIKLPTNTTGLVQ